MRLPTPKDVPFRMQAGEVFFRHMTDVPPFVWLADKGPMMHPPLADLLLQRTDRNPVKFERIAFPTFAPASRWGYEEA